MGNIRSAESVVKRKKRGNVSVIEITYKFKPSMPQPNPTLRKTFATTTRARETKSKPPRGLVNKRSKLNCDTESVLHSSCGTSPRRVCTVFTAHEPRDIWRKERNLLLVGQTDRSLFVQLVKYRSVFCCRSLVGRLASAPAMLNRPALGPHGSEGEGSFHGTTTRSPWKPW